MVRHTCGKCKRQFYKKSELIQHQNTDKCEKRDTPLQILEDCICLFCNRKLSSPEKLKAHQQKFHPPNILNKIEMKHNQTIKCNTVNAGNTTKSRDSNIVNDNS